MFLAALLLALPPDDLPDDDVRAAAVVLERWAEATRGVASVRATYRGFAYDPAFRTVTLTEGEFHHDAANGTLITIRPASVPEKKVYEARGIAHRPESEADSRQYYWDAAGDTLLHVDESRREAFAGSTRPRFYGLAADLSIANVLPFAPGRPFEPDPVGWRFRVALRKADAVFVRAEPTTAETAANFDAIVLAFRRSDWTLRAMRISAPDGSFRDYLLDEVRLNPGPPPRPALEGDTVRDRAADAAPQVGPGGWSTERTPLPEPRRCR